MKPSSPLLSLDGSDPSRFRREVLSREVLRHEVLQPSWGHRVGKFCEKILIVCCFTLFVFLLLAALLSASAAEKPRGVSTRFSSPSEVKAILLHAMKEQVWRGRYKTGHLRLTLPADFPQKGRLGVRSVLWDEASRNFSARVAVNSADPFGKEKKATHRVERERIVSLAGEAIPYVRVLAARRTLLYGTRITRGDLKMVELPVSKRLRFALTEPRQALGKEVRLRRNAGTVLRERDLRPARLVRRRSTVQVAYNEGGVLVVLQALALDNGVHGEMVRLRNKFSGREFLAIVDGVGHASVIENEQANHALDATPESGEKWQKDEQNIVAENPFRVNRQRQYDDLLNKPL